MKRMFLGAALCAAAMAAAQRGLQTLPEQLALALALFLAAGWLLQRSAHGAAATWQLPRGYEFGLLGFLLSAAAGAYFWRLGSLPGFALDYEGDISGSAWQLKDRPYVAIDPLSQPQSCWPTLLYYQVGLLGEVFGWTPAVLRSASALWGLFGLAAFYALARRFFSAPAALLATALLGANGLYLTMSRRLAVVVPLVFFACGMAWALLRAWEKPSLLRWALAGLLAAGAMHFYPSGRLVLLLAPLLLLGLRLYLGRGPGLTELLVFAAVFLAGLAPLLWFEHLHPGAYWGWTSSVNGVRGQGPLAYLQRIADALPIYLRVFTVRGDAHIQDGVTGRPMLDAATGLLFFAGLGLAALRLRELPSFVGLVFLGLGLLPALLGGLFPHPVPRRAILALPGIYLLVAAAAERLWQALGERAWSRWLLALASAAALWMAAGWTGRGYLEFAQTPVAHLYHRGWLASATEVQASFPGADIALSKGHTFMLSQLPFYQQPGKPLRSFRSAEELLSSPAEAGLLAVLEPFDAGTLALLARAVPGAITRTVGWEGRPPLPADPYFGEFAAPDSQLARYHWAYLPAEGLAAARELRLGSEGGPRARAFAPSFGEAQAGKNLRLLGELVVPASDRPAQVSLQMGWKGLRLKLDGRPAAWGKELKLDYGSHRLEIEGRLPAGSRGALPLGLRLNGAPWEPARALLGPLPRKGWSSSSVDLFGKPGPRRRGPDLWAPALRLFDMDPAFAGLRLPVLMSLEGRVRFPEAGRWELGLGRGLGEARADGQLVLQLWPDKGQNLRRYFAASPARPVRIEAQVPVNGPQSARCFTLLCRREGSQEWLPLDPAWAAR